MQPELSFAWHIKVASPAVCPRRCGMQPELPCHGDDFRTGSQAGEHMDFPGGRVPFTGTLSFAGGPDERAAPMACYRTIDSAGGDVPDAAVPHLLGQQGCPNPAPRPVALLCGDPTCQELLLAITPVCRQMHFQSFNPPGSLLHTTCCEDQLVDPAKYATRLSPWRAR